MRTRPKPVSPSSESQSPTRRAVLAAGVVTIGWAWTGGAARSLGPVDVSGDRVRSGGRVTLLCGDASAFAVTLPDHRPFQLAAAAGHLTFRSPFIDGPQRWVPMRCTPLRDGRPVGPTVTVAVLAGSPTFGV